MKIEEKQFIINNKEVIVKIMETYLRNMETAIRKEQDINQKIKLSAVADHIEAWQSQVKNLKVDTPKQGDYTGI